MKFWSIFGYLWNVGGFMHHYDDVIMTMLASQITSLTVVYSIVYSGVNQRKHQSSASLAFVREIHRGPVNFPHKWPVTRKMFPFDDVIMIVKKISTFWLVARNFDICHDEYGPLSALIIIPDVFAFRWMMRVNIGADKWVGAIIATLPSEQCTPCSLCPLLHGMHYTIVKWNMLQWLLCV